MMTTDLPPKYGVGSNINFKAPQAQWAVFIMTTTMSY